MLLTFIEWLAGATPQPGDNEHLRRWLNAGRTWEEYDRTFPIA